VSANVTPSDVQFVWWLATISVFFAVLGLCGWIVERIERRRAKHAEEEAVAAREEAYYREALRTASQLGSVWPPPRNTNPHIRPVTKRIH